PGRIVEHRRRARAGRGSRSLSQRHALGLREAAARRAALRHRPERAPREVRRRRGHRLRRPRARRARPGALRDPGHEVARAPVRQAERRLRPFTRSPPEWKIGVRTKEEATMQRTLPGSVAAIALAAAAIAAALPVLA